jgi:hypothetical protein
MVFYSKIFRKTKGPWNGIAIPSSFSFFRKKTKDP